MREKQKNKWVWEAIMEIGVDRNCKNRKVCKYHSGIRKQGQKERDTGDKPAAENEVQGR